MARWFQSLFGGRKARPKFEGTVGPDPLNPANNAITTKGPAPIRAPAEEAESCDLIMAHIEQHIGPAPTVLHEWQSEYVHIDVIPVPPSKAHPYWIFVTSGMSDLPMHVHDGFDDDPLFAELLICLPHDWPVPVSSSGTMGGVWNDPKNYWPIGLLKLLALYPHQFETWVGHGHTVEYDGAPNTGAPGVAFTNALFMSRPCCRIR